MVPVMLAARKLDGEDPKIIFTLRCAYAAVHAILILICLFMFQRARSFSRSSDGQKVVYIPPPPAPFGATKDNKKYTEAKLGDHVFTTARSLIGSTLFGIAITVGLHVYKGMVVGLAIQSIMGPFNIFENSLFKLFFLGEKSVFNEKSREEVEADAEIVDSSGNPIALKSIKQDDGKKKKIEKTFEEILLDTWDAGENAKLGPLVQALTKSNVNHQTTTDSNHKWTPLMVVCGLGGVDGVAEALKKLKELGADPKLLDSEGWNALHWTAFHGSAMAAKTLLDPADCGGFDGVNLGLYLVNDKEGKTPLDHAIADKNDDVAEVIKNALGKAGATKENDEGLRKRK